MADSTYSAVEHVKFNPIRMHNLFSSFMENDLVLRHFTSEGLQNYSFCMEGLNTIYEAIKMSEINNDSSILNNVEIYIKHLEFSKSLISVERAVLNGDISRNQVKEYYERYRTKLVGFSNQDLENMINIKVLPLMNRTSCGSTQQEVHVELNPSSNDLTPNHFLRLHLIK